MPLLNGYLPGRCYWSDIPLKELSVDLLTSIVAVRRQLAATDLTLPTQGLNKLDVIKK